MKVAIRWAFAASLALVGSAWTAFGEATVYWTPHADDPAGIFTNPVHWSSPAESLGVDDIVEMRNASGDILVRVPSGLDLKTCWRMRLNVSSGRAATFDAGGATLTKTNLPENAQQLYGRYKSGFRVSMGGKDVFGPYGLGVSGTNGDYRIEDALVVVSNGAGRTDAHSVDFMRGTFDLYTPNGFSIGNGGRLNLGPNGLNADRLSFNFRKGVVASFPYVTYPCPTNSVLEINVEDANLTFPCFYSSEIGAIKGDDAAIIRTFLDVKGSNAVVRIDTFSDQSSDERPNTYRMSFSDGATFVPFSVEQRVCENSCFVFRDARLEKRGTYVYWKHARVDAVNTEANLDEFRLVSGAFRMKDSALNIGAGRFGESSGSSARLELTGGVHTFTNRIIMPYADGATAVFALTGCVLRVDQFVGGDNCSAKDAAKTGAAVLVANGATLQARRSVAGGGNFIAWLTDACCGPEGLTIESDYDNRIVQDFRDADGEEGLLAFSGSGEKRFSGVGSTVSRIVATGGTTRILADCVPATRRYSVANGATLDFSGNELGAGLVFSGDGTIGGFSCGAALLAITPGDDGEAAGHIVFRNAAFGGRVAVSFMDEKRRRFRAGWHVVAEFPDGVPDLSAWSVNDSAVDVKAEGTHVLARVYAPGFGIRMR